MYRESSKFKAVRNLLVTAVGWTALLLYILGCRPSWSPDGSKLLFSYCDPDADEVGVALLDPATGAMRKIFVRNNPSYDGRDIPVQWDNDGAHAILWLEEDQILRLPIESSGPVQEIDLPNEVDWSPLPIPQIGGSLYLSGKVVVRVDPATGKVTSRETDRAPLLFAEGDRLFYLTGSDEQYEFGEVDQETLALYPFFELAKEELARLGIEELGYVAADPLGGRIALTGTSGYGARIVLCNESDIERILVPQLSGEPSVLSSIEWSGSRNALYAAAARPSGLQGMAQISIAEIALDDARTRLIPVVQMQLDLLEDEDLGCLLQAALSPDESRIALSTTDCDKSVALEAEDRALFIVDLEDPQRRVTKFPWPSEER